ncbi:hypothetical protein BASA81_002704 [Batrachochytrium salamandrivorans]|nr:hypothetical protein BASA81_002704 [Batrachochytrium salamandrivorans]
MFRLVEDEFLRKGDYSRNCLTFEEEESERAKLLAGVKLPQLPEPCALASKVYVSCGGMCTEPFIRRVVECADGAGVEWRSSALGVLGIQQNELVAVLADSQTHRLGAHQRSRLEREIVQWLFSCPVAATTADLVVVSSIPLNGHYDSMQCRFLSFPPQPAVNKRLLEKGRLLTGLPAALLERALRGKTPSAITVTCCLVPREPVLALESLDSLLQASAILAPQVKKSLLESTFRTWSKHSLVEDEKLSRLTEPEGMFM